MAEVLGTAASLISIIGLAKTCIDLYDIVADGKHASKDLDQLVSFLRIERVRFFLWCQYVGFADLIILKAAAAQGTDLTLGEIKQRITPHAQHAWVLQGVAKSMQHIERTFRESRDLLTTYTTQKRTSLTSILLNPLSIAQQTQNAVLDLVGFEADQSVEDNVIPKRGMTGWEATKWAVKDKKRFKSLVDDLRLFNNGLEAVLSLMERNRLLRQRELLATTTPLAETVANIGDVGSGTLCSESDHTSLQQLVELYHRGAFIMQDSGEDDIEKVNKVLRGSAYLKSPSQNLSLLLSDIGKFSTEEPLHQTRAITTYKSRPALVEWKYYSRNIEPSLLAALRRRVDMLAYQLQQSSRIPGFNVLSCLGYFNDDTNHRVGIVFELTDPNAKSGLISLRDRMVQDRKDRIVRELGTRFQMATALTMTFFRLHSVSWLHKSLRSDNVLLFGTDDQDDHGLEQPYVCGFDFSRQDSPLEMTENIPSVLYDQHVNRDHRLYRHPDLQPRLLEDHAINEEDQAGTQKSCCRYCKAYDIYSLGIILLEIGLWRPIGDHWKKNDSYDTFQDRLWRELVPELRYRMGKTYFNVVKKCLTGNFGGWMNGLPPNNETESNASRYWLEAFEKDAVSELEKCSV